MVGMCALFELFTRRCTSRSTFTYMSKIVTECVSGWNMWVFIGETVNFLSFSIFLFYFYCLLFTATDSPQGIHVQACLRRAGSRALGMEARLRDHAKAPWGLTGVADAGKVRESADSEVDSKSYVWERLPPETAGAAAFLWTTTTTNNLRGFLISVAQHKLDKQKWKLNTLSDRLVVF